MEIVNLELILLDNLKTYIYWQTTLPIDYHKY